MTAPTASAMQRAEYVTTDIEAAHEFLRAQYADHTPNVSGDKEDFRFRASMTREDRFGVEFVSHSMELHTVVEPYEALLIPHLLNGKAGLTGKDDEVRAMPGEEFLVPPDEQLALSWTGPRLGVIRLSTDAVTRMASDLTEGELRFRLARPVSADAARYWRSVVGHVTRDFLANPAAVGSPIIRTEMFRLLTTALIETFPILVRPELPRPATEPAAVRRATQFIDDHAHLDIGLREIAKAARISPRALQASFRRHLDTTPIAYLREARLHRAHLGLQAADPTKGDTVGSIATAWGFTHHGRFAAAYRQCYGRSPRQTLLS